MPKSNPVSDTRKGQLPSGTTFEVREPTLGDLEAVEQLALAEGKTLGELGEIGSSLLLFAQVCTAFGDKEGLTVEEVRRLPLSALKGVSEVMGSFRN